MSKKEVHSVLYRPADASKPRTHVNVRHERIVKSFEFEASDGLLYGGLYVQEFSGDQFHRIGRSDRSDYIGEVMNPDGDFLYCRRLGNGVAHVVRWDLSVKPMDMQEEVVLELGKGEVARPDTDHVELFSLVDVLPDGRVLVVAREEENDGEFTIGTSYFVAIWDVEQTVIEPLTPARKDDPGRSP